jgi:hypothetical protein
MTDDARQIADLRSGAQTFAEFRLITAMQNSCEKKRSLALKHGGAKYYRTKDEKQYKL